MNDTSSGGWEFATGVGLDSFVPWTDAYAAWGYTARGAEASGTALLLKLQLQVVWNQLEGAWRLLSKDIYILKKKYAWWYKSA